MPLDLYNVGADPRDAMDTARLLAGAPDIAAGYDPAALVGRGAALDVGPALHAGINLDQYLGPWAIEPVRGMQVFGALQGYDLTAHVRLAQANAATAADRGRTGSAKVQRLNVGVVELQGALTKRGSSMGSGADSLLMVGRSVARFAADDEVDAIILVIDSPGGTVAGTQEVVQRVAQARESKPVVAWVRDLCASAAYWIASQCDAVYANVPTAYVGSIGTYIGLYDMSVAAEKAGVEAVVVKARADKDHQLKGMAFPGTKLTDEHRAYLQELADACQDEFSAGVAAGRGISQKKVEALATGRVWPASDKASADLLDGVKTWEEVLDATAGLASKSGRTPVPPAPKKPTPRSDTENSGPTAGGPQTAPPAAAGGGAGGVTAFNPYAGPAADVVTPTPASPLEARILQHFAPPGSNNAAGSTHPPAPGSTGEASPDTPDKDTTMPEDSKADNTPAADTKPKAATLADLKGAFPKADNDFLVEQLGAEATLDQARSAYQDRLEAKLADAEQARADAEAKAKPHGNTTPLGDGKTTASGDGTTDAVAEFEEAVNALTAAGMTRPQANEKVCRDKPELRKRYVAAKNVGLGRTRQAAEVLAELN